MQQVISNITTYSCNESTIFYDRIGNFMPPEWKNLSDLSGRLLSKTARQLLSLIVYHIQLPKGEELKELQESYYFFEQELGVGQRRVRQCLLELQDAGLIALYSTTVVKHNVKCRNILCISLIKKFQPNVRKFQVHPKRFTTTLYNR